MNESLSYVSMLVIVMAVFVVLYIIHKARIDWIKHREAIQAALMEQRHHLTLGFQEAHQTAQLRLQEQLAQAQLTNQELIGQNIQRQMRDVREQLAHSFQNHATALTTHLQSIIEEIRHQLFNLSQQVNLKLSEGFEKTSSTFIDVVARLTMIDEAQKKITELSTHVVNLQDILVDKQARGAFGEVQLTTLIANMIPSNHYQLQYTLSNQKRADCILFLPEPTGSIVIDAKFPLETYQKLMHPSKQLSPDKRGLEQQFRQDVTKHIKDIAEKYIIPNETADSAVMFIPAEAIFAEIHLNLELRFRHWAVREQHLEGFQALRQSRSPLARRPGGRGNSPSPPRPRSLRRR